LSIESTGSLEMTASRSFLGWQMVGVAFVAQFLASGAMLSAFSNFVMPVSETFEVSRGTVVLGVPMAIGAIGLLGPFIGRMLDRGHARRLMTIGALLSSAGLILISRAESLPVVAFLYGGCVCLGAALFGPMPSMTLVASWFIRRRGLALGLTFAGATLVSYLGPVSAEYWIETQGWRAAVSYFGAIVALVGVPTFWLFTIGRPEEVGQLPDGERPDSEPVASIGSLSAGELARDPRLWLLAVGFGLILTSPIVLLTLLVPFAKDELGFSGQQANLFFLAMMPFSLMGKIVIGALADIMPPKPAIALIVVMNVALWLIFYSEPSLSLYLAAGVIYGIGIGGAAPLQGVIVGRCFGRANFGMANGLGGIPGIGLLVLASVMSSLLQGEGEGYPTIFLAQIGMLLLGGLLLSVVRIPPLEEAAG